MKMIGKKSAYYVPFSTFKNIDDIYFVKSILNEIINKTNYGPNEITYQNNSIQNVLILNLQRAFRVV